MSSLRDVVYAAAVTTADADLRSFGLGHASQERATRSLHTAKKYLTLAKDLATVEAGDDYRITVAAVEGVVDLYNAYVLKQLDGDVLDKAERTFREAINVNPGQAVHQNYNIFVVAVHNAYAFGKTTALSTAKEAILKYIRALPSELENRNNSSFEGRIKKWLTGIIVNSREDPFVVTRPIGGKAIAGESMARFFAAHPKITQELRNVF